MTSDKGIIHSEVLETYLTVFILLVPDFYRIKSSKLHGIMVFPTKLEATFPETKLSRKVFFVCF